MKNPYGTAASNFESAPTRQMVRHMRLIAAGMFVVLIVMPLTFSGHEIIVDVNDGTVFYVEKSWWGLARKEREIRWMKTADYSFPGWMARDASGRWYLFFTDDGTMEPTP